VFLFDEWKFSFSKKNNKTKTTTNPTTISTKPFSHERKNCLNFGQCEFPVEKREKKHTHRKKKE